MKIGDLFSIKTFRGPVRKEGPFVKDAGVAKETVTLSQGQLLKGKVLSISENSRATIEIDGKQISARSRVPLKAGSEIWLEVVKAGKEPELVLAPKKGATIELIKLLSDAQVMERAVHLLLGFNPASSGQVPSNILNNLALILRLFTENAMGEKPYLGKILQGVSWFTAGDHSIVQGLDTAAMARQLADLLGQAGLDGNAAGQVQKSDSASLEKFLGLLETLGQYNSLPDLQSKGASYLFPCFFATQSGWGIWMFNSGEQRTREEEEGRGVFSLTFFLSMSRLGEVTLKLCVNEKRIQGEFLHDDGKAAAYMEKNLPEIRELLGTLGYGPIYFSCRVKSSSYLHAIRNSLLEGISMQSFALIDTTV